MKHLAERRDITIITTDKGGAVVILDTENYLKEVNHQLSDKNNYKTLQTDPTLQHIKMVNDILDRFRNENLFSKNTAEEQNVINPKTPKFFVTPNIRKENHPGKHPKKIPGRPVINSIYCHTSEIWHFVEHHLQPFVRGIPSYIRDNNDFVIKIKNLKVP